MQPIIRELDKNADDTSRFDLVAIKDRVWMCLPRNRSGKIGFLRIEPAKVITKLLSKPGVEFEPRGRTSKLKDDIGHAYNSATSVIKVDIDVYGPRSLASAVGDDLSDGKLWLQRPRHEQDDKSYENPHVFTIKIGGVRLDPVQIVQQRRQADFAKREQREDQLKKMVDEVYKRVNESRNLEMVEDVEGVSRDLLRCVILLFCDEYH
jgi:SWI/SNF-related matrix-associated actin-dependent regulator of chromatin subfamily A3